MDKNNYSKDTKDSKGLKKQKVMILLLVLINLVFSIVLILLGSKNVGLTFIGFTVIFSIYSYRVIKESENRDEEEANNNKGLLH